MTKIESFNSNITLKCAHCTKEFKYESERKRHEQSHFPQFECRICSQKFSFNSALRRHQKQHERTGTVQCSDCGGHFRDETLLMRHIKYAHKGKYACSKCSATFSSESALHTHMKTHKPVSERRYRCRYSGCNKAFNFAHHLKHHEFTHTNSKQHYCNVCGKGFIQSHHLKTHLKMHEPDNWLCCTIPGCKKIFPTEYARKRHLVSHKNKSNSRISSDTNSSLDIPELVNDMLLCSSRRESMLQGKYANHMFECFNDINDTAYKYEDCLDLSVSTSHKECSEHNKPLQDNDSLPFININNSHNVRENLFQNDINSCKSALGGCLMDEKSDGIGKCLCAQISTAVIDYPDITPPIEIKHESYRTYNEKAILDDVSQNCDNSRRKNGCKGCKCVTKESSVEVPSKVCSNLIPLHDFNQKVGDNRPEIEYGIDGTVKIKETMDADIIIEDNKEFVQKVQIQKNKVKYIPYNSCKAVLGNCIVSGDGTISEGCLCAKMITDEQHMTAQEIEEITPQPTVIL